ncbi:MAG: hypothetical protein A3F78_09580 [Burkholderiales bacterium RIFCSPLOWO2_12_FULL_61_40]|nr:MAG: hypothetical protein A3F78_09580 [Burkholderiales bacterium RIFCSPLOWO2_12_FULL_61_40]
MNQQATEQHIDPSKWEGDAFNRKIYADFLSQYIEMRVSKTDEPLTVALDAAWGTGKTFFVNKWASDIEARNGGVIIFDAWKNDFSNEVLVSFMAELSIGMKPLRERIATTVKVAEVLNQQTKSLMSGFRKAALPAAGAIAKGVLKKLTGMAVDEIVDAIESGNTPDVDDFDLEKATEGAVEDLEKGLETFFEKTLEAHQARSAATQDFKDALELLVKTLQAESAIEGPLYIFVDELDRCRPDYAIKLLEGIKHLFAVNGVVFVVSTNMDQLSKSVQAVYGGNFDGFGYLKRFFDFEFTLPQPDFYSFAQVLMRDLPLFTGRNINYGLDEPAYKKEVLLARSFELITSAFNLPLRSQKQVWMIASAASSGIPANSQISVLWLFFLSVLRHSHPETLEKLGEKLLSLDQFKELCKPIGGISGTSAKSFHRVERQNGYGHFDEASFVELTNILYVYHKAVFETIDEISKRMNQDSLRYPKYLVNNMVNERPNPYNPEIEYRPFIQHYQKLVKMAGLMS